ncbi:MAG TPA: hypothetical protein VLR69_16950 [Thermoanaerobaculia bacterium]|nr:hypothetical protein [Thermoanaerobaculia bacterium]
MSKPDTRNQLAVILARWELLLAAAEANQDDLCALEHYRAQLKAALEDTRAAHERKLGHVAAARQATQEVRALVRLGRDLAAQLESGVRLLYGRRNPKLREFGVKPLLPRARKKAVPRCAVQGCPLEASATAK